MPCKADRSGVYHCCEAGAVLVEVDRCVTSAAAAFKQLTARMREGTFARSLEFVFAQTDTYLMPAENCLQYIYTRVCDGLELRSEEALHSRGLPPLCILTGG